MLETLYRFQCLCAVSLQSKDRELQSLGTKRNWISLGLIIKRFFMYCFRYFIFLVCFLATSSLFAQSCRSVIGESPLETTYKDGSSTCKLRLTDGQCKRVPASETCPGGSIVQITDNESAAALEAQKIKEKKQTEEYNLFLKRMKVAEICDAYSRARNDCAVAGSYDQCMSIRAGSDYKKIQKQCNTN